MEERRLLIAVALSLLVLTAYQFLFADASQLPTAFVEDVVYHPGASPRGRKQLIPEASRMRRFGAR